MLLTVMAGVARATKRARTQEALDRCAPPLGDAIGGSTF